MTGLQISLLIIGVVFLVGSFFVTDKLSKKDIDMIAKMSEDELKLVVEKQLKEAKTEIQTAIETGIDETTDVTKRALEKETNDKIMGISEYSDTVLESINKSHNEIMFLYSMLNDKHKELTELASDLQDFSSNLRTSEDEMLGRIADAAAEIEQRINEAEPIDEQKILEQSVVNSASDNTSVTNVSSVINTLCDSSDISEENSKILELHKDGKTDVEIAKELGRGLGEVKLVLGLYKGEISSEA